MKTKPTTAIQIRNGQLVVAGFFVGGWELPGMYAEGGPMITNPRFIHNGDFVDPSQPLDIDMGSLYQREVTMMYNLEPNQFSRATSLETWISDISVPNKAQIDPGLRESIFKALHPETWYPHSRGTVGRKPAFEGQKPVKDVVVIGGGGFRRDTLPILSAHTDESKSRFFDSTLIPTRGLNHGLTAEEITNFRRPVNIPTPESLKFRDYLGLLGNGMQGAEQKALRELTGRLRKFTLDKKISMVTPRGPLR